MTFLAGLRTLLAGLMTFLAGLTRLPLGLVFVMDRVMTSLWFLLVIIMALGLCTRSRSRLSLWGLLLHLHWWRILVIFIIFIVILHQLIVKTSGAHKT